MISVPSPTGVPTYRYDPYALKVLGTPPTPTLPSSGYSFSPFITEPSENFNHYANNNLSWPSTSSSGLLMSSCDISDTSSDQSSPMTLDQASTRTTAIGLLRPGKFSSEERFASIKFKFTNGIFSAPFRTQSGDVVVVEFNDKTVHIGLVTAVTQNKPPLGAEGKLIRHARDYDRQEKNDAMRGDVAMVRAAQDLLENTSNSLLSSHTIIRDVERWLDGSRIAVLVDFSGSPKEQEGLEQTLRTFFGMTTVLIVGVQHATTKGLGPLPCV